MDKWRMKKYMNGWMNEWMNEWLVGWHVLGNGWMVMGMDESQYHKAWKQGSGSVPSCTGSDHRENADSIPTQKPGSGTNPRGKYGSRYGPKIKETGYDLKCHLSECIWLLKMLKIIIRIQLRLKTVKPDLNPTEYPIRIRSPTPGFATLRSKWQKRKTKGKKYFFFIYVFIQ